MIKKETFCSLLKTCRGLWDYIRQLEAVHISLDDDNPIYHLIDSIIYSLDAEFDTENISYYFYERLSDGSKMNGEPTPFLWEADGTEVWIHSDEELYTYLVKCKTEEG